MSVVWRKWKTTL